MTSASPDDFHQLKLLFSDPVQHAYEAIRPVVLFADTIATRSQQTGLDPTTLGEKARRFVQAGMLGLVDQRMTRAGRSTHQYPELVAAYILYIKQLYPPLHDREIVRIIQRKFGYHTNHHTLKRVLTDHAIPVQLPLQWTTFHQFADAYRARWTVVRLYYEGWHIQSIAGCLKLSRQHVWKILTAFEADGFAGLEDQRTRPAAHPANQLTLPFLKEVLDVQHAYPRAGRFRLRGILRQRLSGKLASQTTIGRAMALNRRLHGAPGPWSTDRPPQPQETGPKHAPYRSAHPHHYGFIDIRYLRQLEERWVYSICVLDGYSRKILAGMASAYQDEIAVLQLLTAALREYGCPVALVSDNGAVFTAYAYCGLLETLGIQPRYIAKGKPWENLMEAQFKVQLRLADAAVARAASLAEIQHAHAACVERFNSTPHAAHSTRDAATQAPAAVWGGRQGRRVAPDELRQVLRELQFERTVRPNGYVSIQRFSRYAERGLARQRVSIWRYDGRLQIAYREALLASYTATYQRTDRQLRTVTQPVVYATPYRSPQLECWELDDDQWRKVVERPLRRRRTSTQAPSVEQLALPLVSLLILLLWRRGAPPPT